MAQRGVKKILVIQPNQEFAKSHFSFTINLVHVLIEAGHDVHLLVPLLCDEERLEQKLEQQFKVIYFMASQELRKAEEHRKKHVPPFGIGGVGSQQPPVNGFAFAPPTGPHQHRGRRPTGIFAKLYIEMASDRELMAKLRAEHFDIGMAEAFMINEWSLVLFRLLALPRVIVTTAMAPVPEYFYYMGLLGRIKKTGIPSIRGTKIGDHLEANKRQRKEELWNAFVEATAKALAESIEINVAFQEVAEQFYGIQALPPLSEIFSQVDAYLCNSQPELDFTASAKAILTAPGNKIHYVGGMNAMRARQNGNGKSLDREILARVVSKEGLVLFTLGTVLNTNNGLHAQQFEAIRGAFDRFPELLFVCKLTEGDARIEQLNGEMPNVFASHWVDQPAILAHPSTMLFISHCGMNSALEAAWNGVPLVCIPCMGDQYYNSEALAEKGAAVVLDFFDPAKFTTDTFADAIAQALGNDEEGKCRADTMRKLGEKMREKDLEGNILTAVIGTSGK